MKLINVLFLCTGNSCRSIIAEVLLNEFGKDKFKAFSAGSIPTGAVNPDSINVLKQHGFMAVDVSSKSWDDLPVIDFEYVITVCDNAASEVCPVYLDNAIKAHWGIADPDKIIGDNRQAAFELTYNQLLDRVTNLLKLSELTSNNLNRIGNESI